MGVDSLGPSSNVSAIDLRAPGPRYTDFDSNCEPRAAIPYAAAAAKLPAIAPAATSTMPLSLAFAENRYPSELLHWRRAARDAMDLTTLSFAMGSAWLSGINLYATVATLGLLERFHFVRLPGDLSYLSHPWVIGAALALFALEFLADKVPAVDSVWDFIHTFIRIPAGAVLAASAFAHFDPKIRLLAFLLGGTLALSSHGAKAATRLAANTSPEPFSNMGLSLIEDVIAVGFSVLMAKHPVIVATLAVVGLMISVILIRFIWRALRRLFRRRPAEAAA